MTTLRDVEPPPQHGNEIGRMFAAELQPFQGKRNLNFEIEQLQPALKARLISHQTTSRKFVATMLVW